MKSTRPLCGLAAIAAALTLACPIASGMASSRKAPANDAGQLKPETLVRVEAALVRGSDYLLAQQSEDGSWGRHKHPAIAALCAMALHQAPASDAAASRAGVGRALDYIVGYAQKNGAIYPADRDQTQSANYPNYTTSIALLALATANRPGDIETMRRARAYLQGSQFADQGKIDYGGIGYGRTGRADLSNGGWAAEALYFTEYLDNEPHNKAPAAAKNSREMWDKLAIFLTQCQNLPATNKNAYVSQRADDLGGFIYRPHESKAGSRDGDGKVSNLISSGSMTYAGLKSMIYARLDRSDPRVKGAMGYLMRHYSMTENPGMGMQGYYYYLMMMTKALEAWGKDIVTDEAGAEHFWRRDVAGALLERQGTDGSWANTSGRYMESLPELATPYAMICIRGAAGQFPLKYGK